jgi:phosphatidylglycerophosphate synthase
VKVLREIAHPVWMLACVALALAQHDVAWCAAGGLVGICVRLAAARGSWTPSGALGLANQITLFRLAVVAGMPWLFAALPRFGFVALVMALLVLDGVDGWAARSRGEASAFGAALDMETDALTIMVLVLLLFGHRVVGAWVLVAGLWRYVFVLAVALVPSLGDAPRSNFYRIVFVVLMICFAGAFVPWASFASVAAAVGTTLASISFIHSLARSSAFGKPAIGSVPP